MASICGRVCTKLQPFSTLRKQKSGVLQLPRLKEKLCFIFWISCVCVYMHTRVYCFPVEQILLQCFKWKGIFKKTLVILWFCKIIFKKYCKDDNGCPSQLLLFVKSQFIKGNVLIVAAICCLWSCVCMFGGAGVLFVDFSIWKLWHFTSIRRTGALKVGLKNMNKTLHALLN